eukprot:GDKI01030410.1.p1 GENE.GDKI01030410.1~~GDKI01030410.1.p1  ORF type:complete len:160 (+),score=11.70 GDKI01030410.1:188-667(+)
MKFRWRNATCSDRAFKLIEEAVREVETKILSAASEAILKGQKAPEQPHIPTALNDRLFPYCIAVAVAPNVGTWFEFYTCNFVHMCMQASYSIGMTQQSIITKGSRFWHAQICCSCTGRACLSPHPECAGEGSCFRGMEVAQFEMLEKVYNIAVVLRPEV